MILGRRRTAIMLILAAFAALLAACGRPTEPGSPTEVATAAPVPVQALEGTDWVLTSLQGAGPLAGTQILLGFSEGRAAGFAGCNHYGGTYIAAEGGTLTIGEIAITAEGCLEPEGVLEQEDAYVDALTSAAAYAVGEDRLEIFDASGQVTLTFARQAAFAMDPADLLDTRWRLVSMGESAPLEGASITLVFHDQNLVSGDVGCRGYVASYQAEGDDIGFPMLAMTGPSDPCAEEVLAQDAAYTTHLELVTTYRLGERTLEFFTAPGHVLRFEPLPDDADAPLEGTAWTLLAMVEMREAEGMGTPVVLPAEPLPGTGITATFEDGQVHGSAGCNTYRGAYAVDGHGLAFGALATTRMACADPEGIMEQEQRYLGLLGGVRRYRIDGGQLWLATDDGQALVFRSPPASADCLDPDAFPPEDAELVWPTLLDANPVPAAPGEEVQVRGTGGYLTWETACGSSYEESARRFALSLDGGPAGSLECYANTCLATLVLPEDVTPGKHTVSAEGGSSLDIQVGQD
jgi:heat shock protein HslJ